MLERISVSENVQLLHSQKQMEDKGQDSPINKKPCRQECGIVTELDSGVICILFEDVPMCLFALTNLNCEHIYMPSVDSFTHFLKCLEAHNMDIKLFNKLIQDIGRRKFMFCTTKNDQTIYLVSGSLSFLNDQYNTLQNKPYMMIIGENKTY